jgi:hypothetical protein
MRNPISQEAEDTYCTHIEMQPFTGGDSTAPLIEGMPEYLRPSKLNIAKMQLDKTPAPLPDWLSAPDPIPPSNPEHTRAVTSLLHEQYKIMLPRVLERICSGATLNKILEDDFRGIDPGGFMRWIKTNPKYYELYKEAKEVRTESWVGKIVQHAEGTTSLDDVQRSKLIVDTYKWLIECDDRKSYGKTQQINVAGSISITDALEQAKMRVIEGTFREVEE